MGVDVGIVLSFSGGGGGGGNWQAEKWAKTLLMAMGNVIMEKVMSRYEICGKQLGGFEK